jgi:hypothetical protein
LHWRTQGNSHRFRVPAGVKEAQLTSAYHLAKRWFIGSES